MSTKQYDAIIEMIEHIKDETKKKEVLKLLIEKLSYYEKD
jgi:hypothetical protein